MELYSTAQKNGMNENKIFAKPKLILSLDSLKSKNKTHICL